MKRFGFLFLLAILVSTVIVALIGRASPRPLWPRGDADTADRDVPSASAEPPANEEISPARNAASGPYRWRNVEIGGTGFITGVIFHPKASGVVYARTDIGGAYRWDPAGQRWIPLQDWVGPDEWTLLGVESLALDPQDARRVYLAAGMYTNNWSGNGSILRSTDQGDTWERTPMPFKFGGNEDGRSIGERLAVDPNLGSRLLLGTRHNGLWKSEDHGRTWREQAAFPARGSRDGTGVGFVIFDGGSSRVGQPSSTIYAGVGTPQRCLHRSTDAGATWEEIAGQPHGLIPHHGALAADGTLYLTYGDKPGPNGVADGAVWKLDTRSGHWTDITPVKPGTGSGDRFGYAGLAVDAADPKKLVVATMDRWGAGDDVFRSIDGGATWTPLAAKATRDVSAAPYLAWGKSTASFGHWIGAMAINPFDGRQAFYVTGATLWGTDNLNAADRGLPTRWTVRARGIEEAAVHALVSPPSGPELISALGDVGGFRHDDLAASPAGGVWTNPTMNNVYALDFAQQHPEIVVRVGSGGGGTRGAFSLDGAKTWQPFGGEPATSRGVRDRSRSVAVAADGSAFVWVAPDGFAHVSRDRGTTWQRCEGLGMGTTVIADRVDAKVFYALSPGERKLFASQDGGVTFQERTQDLPARASRLQAVPAHGGDLWLCAGESGLWRSRDGGRRFQRVDGVASADNAGFGKAAPGRGYDAVYLAGSAGKIKGIFRSDDEGVAWERINDDRHRYGWINPSITGDPRVYGRVYVGSNGRGILCGEPAVPEKLTSR